MKCSSRFCQKQAEKVKDMTAAPVKVTYKGGVACKHTWIRPLKDAPYCNECAYRMAHDGHNYGHYQKGVVNKLFFRKSL